MLARPRHGDDPNGDNLTNECNPRERAHLSKCHLPSAELESAYITAALNWATIARRQGRGLLSV